MALIILEKSKCSICNELLVDVNDIVATTAFISEPDDPLWRYSDSGMHRTCFLNWSRKEEFSHKFNEANQNRVSGNGTFKRLEEDGTISVLSARPRDTHE